jgi:hypothetical protein
MTYFPDRLDSIFERTSGICHICQGTLCRSNYGKFGQRGAWEVEHSVPRSLGGTDHLNNLFAACCSCNRKKSNYATRTARAWHGNTRAPLSIEKRRVAKTENTVLGGFFGAILGAVVITGPVGLVIGLIAGSNFGNSLDPDKTG